MSYTKSKIYVGRAIPPKPAALTAPEPSIPLPPLIRDAVLEVKNNIQAPLDLVIASALGAVSLACQNAIDVQWGVSKSISPCSLFFLTIAASGDRKSTVGRQFTDPITKFEKERIIDYGKQLTTYNTKIDRWNDTRKDIKLRLKKATREGVASEDLEVLELSLIAHDEIIPSHPKRRKLIYTDATPESIVYGLHRDWPSAAILSEEAGGILNGRAMNDLGKLNQIWDGDSLSVDRKSSESFTLDGARLTISLMTQEKSLRKFIERNDGMARDIGFLARCLVSNPPSLQGERSISNTNEATFVSEKLDKFKERLSFILHENIKAGSAPDHKKKVLKLSSEADEAWAKYFNEIEMRSESNGELADVWDAASKIANNVLRMAAMFHYFQGREEEDISGESMNEAILTCNKYMVNFSTMFGAYGFLSPEKRDVDKLVKWFKLKLRGIPEIHIHEKNYIRQRGPIRNSYLLDKALDYLHSQGAVILIFEDRTELVELKVGNKLFCH
jgi:hypothetical protein